MKKKYFVALIMCCMLTGCGLINKVTETVMSDDGIDWDASTEVVGGNGIAEPEEERPDKFDEEFVKKYTNDKLAYGLVYGDNEVTFPNYIEDIVNGIGLNPGKVNKYDIGDSVPTGIMGSYGLYPDESTEESVGLMSVYLYYTVDADTYGYDTEVPLTEVPIKHFEAHLNGPEGFGKVFKVNNNAEFGMTLDEFMDLGIGEFKTIGKDDQPYISYSTYGFTEDGHFVSNAYRFETRCKFNEIYRTEDFRLCAVDVIVEDIDYKSALQYAEIVKLYEE